MNQLKKDILARLYIFSSLIALAYLVLVIIYKGFLIRHIIPSLIAFFIFFIFWYVLTHSHLSKRLARVGVAVLIAVLPGSFFGQNGFSAMYVLDNVNLLISIVLIGSGVEVLLLIAVVAMLNIMFMVGYHSLFPYIVNEYIVSARFDSSFGVISRLACTVNIVWVVKNAYQKERAVIEHQKNTIAEINNSLEAKVMERTNEIEQQNKRLNAIIFFNSHNVKASLARIMGILYLIRISNNSNQDTLKNFPELERYLYMLESACDELSVITKEISEISNA